MGILNRLYESGNPESPVPNAAAVRGAIVLLGRHDGEDGDGGGVLVPSLDEPRL